jgi:hypothetical protein
MEVVAGVILRTVAAGDYDRGDPRHWRFPSFASLLPPLRDAAWQAALAGELVFEGIKGITGQRHQPLAPALLPRLTPDWELARLTRDGRDEWLEIRVHPMPATEIPRPWQPKPSLEQIRAAAEAIAKAYPPPDGWLPFAKFWAALKTRAGAGVTKRQALRALDDHAPHLRVEPGQRSKNKSPS